MMMKNVVLFTALAAVPCSWAAQATHDADLELALALSASEQEQKQQSAETEHKQSAAQSQEDVDLARAIHMSLQVPAASEGDRKVQAAQPTTQVTRQEPKPARVLFFGVQPAQPHQQAKQQKDSKLSALEQETLNKLMIQAAFAGDVNKVALYLDQGADIDCMRDDPQFLPDQNILISALHHAAKMSNLPLVDLLIQRKANPNLVNNFGDTALFQAIRYKSGHSQDHKNIIAGLLAAKANINHASDIGMTPLRSAMRASDIPMLDFLLKHGARLDSFRIVQEPLKLSDQRWITFHTPFNACTPQQFNATNNVFDQPYADIKKFLDNHRWKVIQDNCVAAQPHITKALESCIAVDVKPLAALIAQYAATVPLGDHEIAITLIQDGLPENIDPIERQSLASIIAEYTGTIHPGEPLRLIEVPKKPSTDDADDNE